MRQEGAEQHWLGIGLTTASTVAYSTAGFFTRLVHIDPWTILFWRGSFAGLFIACFIVWRYRRDTWAAARAIGLPGLAVASLSTLATILFINAFRRTSVADVTIIFATAPFVTASLNWLWTGERESWATLVASTGALIGVIVMVGGAVMEGHLFGDLLAFGMTICMALVMIIIRRHRDTPMLPAASQRERWRRIATLFRVFDCASRFGCEKYPYQIWTSTSASRERSIRDRVRRPGALRSAVSARPSPFRQGYGSVAEVWSSAE